MLEPVWFIVLFWAEPISLREMKNPVVPVVDGEQNNSMKWE